MRGLLLGLCVLVVGCGDNSRQCGPGTTEVNGVCTGIGTGACGDGTMLDPETNTCVVDPSTCQDGTVLIGSECVDPGHVNVDVEEGAEPNGLAVLGEDSAAPAGQGAIKAIGEKLVIHGKIVPFQDLLDVNNAPTPDGQIDPDIDTYLIQTSAPAMLEVSADGMHGLSGAFLSLAAVDVNDPLATWQRFGINFHGDTSRRQLFLPAPGTYAIAVTDSRTMFTNQAVSADDGAQELEYYVSISQQAIAPVALTVTAGVATDSGQLAPGEVKLFTVPMGDGFNQATFDITGDGDAVPESLVVTNTRGGVLTVKGVADDDGAGGPPVFSALGFRAGDTTLVVADHRFSFEHDPVDYDLTVTTGSAGQLPTDGTSVTQPTGTIPAVFFWDVAAGEIHGMDIAFDIPVSGFVVDENNAIYAQLTFNPIDDFFFGDGFASGDAFTSYRGLFRHPVAGRFYFVVHDPALTATDIVATSTHAALTPTPVVKGTVLTNQAVNQFESNPFSYAADRNTDAWQQFNVIGTATGQSTASFFDPATTSGRLDALTVTSGADGTTAVNNCSSLFFGPLPCSDDAIPVFSQRYAQAGTVNGRVLLDDPVDNFLVTINTTTTAGASFNVDFQRRPHVDLATVAAGATATANDQALGLGGIQRYLVRTSQGNKVSITSHPDQVTLDTRIQRLTNVETNRGAASANAIPGQNDVTATIQNGEGWTAFQITPTVTINGDTFDLTVAADTNNIAYTASAGTTVFANACQGPGFANVPMSDADEGASNAVINTPAGFVFFGIAEPQLRVFSNGFLSFDTSATCAAVGSSCFFQNETIPSGFPNSLSPDGIVAPFWSDLVVTSVCRKLTGGKLIIQWTGTTFDPGPPDAVRFQAILDPTNDSIEFVYAAVAQHNQDGSFATVGVEDQGGFSGTEVGFNVSGTVTPGTSIKLTPN